MRTTHGSKAVGRVGLIAGVIGILWLAPVAPASAIIDCTNGTSISAGNYTLIDNYVHNGGGIPCITYTNTAGTSATLDGGGHTIACANPNGCGPAIVVQEGNRVATVEGMHILGPFSFGVDARPVVTQSKRAYVVGNRIEDFDCVGVAGAWRINDNIIVNGGESVSHCGFQPRGAIQWTPPERNAYCAVEGNMIDSVGGINVLSTYTGSDGTAPLVSGNLINASVASPIYYHIYDLGSAGGKVNIEQNFFTSRDDGSAYPKEPILLGGAMVAEDNVCDTVFQMFLNDPGTVCSRNYVIPFSLP